MPDRRHTSALHISSAVVTAWPARCDEVVDRIRELPDTEVYRVENGKIVVVLEGHDTGEVCDRLAAIALIDGVFSANLVLEQIETFDDRGAES